MKSFVSTFTITLFITFFMLKVFVPSAILNEVHIPPKVGLVLSTLILLNILGATIKANYILCICLLICSALLVAVGMYKLANDIAVIFYILLGATIIYDFVQTLTTQYRKNSN